MYWEGLRVVGIKTDALIVNNKIDDIINTGIVFKEGIGGLKIELNKYLEKSRIVTIKNKSIPICTK